ncbi:hypothetical protein, variant [Salpingoeca rosetta]|nr:hypothetical protein, variant [Salpingoeca rosetta]EGD78157.1 hypothetical protein, variant [Salpingoeca rosetta]|eukprot:XP_004989833.1 hypothetical protein, variant [Salpingoeca rosetta]
MDIQQHRRPRSSRSSRLPQSIPTMRHRRSRSDELARVRFEPSAGNATHAELKAWVAGTSISASSRRQPPRVSPQHDAWHRPTHTGNDPPPPRPWKYPPKPPEFADTGILEDAPLYHRIHQNCHQRVTTMMATFAHLRSRFSGARAVSTSPHHVWQHQSHTHHEYRGFVHRYASHDSHDSHGDGQQQQEQQRELAQRGRCTWPLSASHRDSATATPTPPPTTITTTTATRHVSPTTPTATRVTPTPVTTTTMSEVERTKTSSDDLKDIATETPTCSQAHRSPGSTMLDYAHQRRILRAKVVRCILRLSADEATLLGVCIGAPPVETGRELLSALRTRVTSNGQPYMHEHFALNPLLLDIVTECPELGENHVLAIAIQKLLLHTRDGTRTR